MKSLLFTGFLFLVLVAGAWSAGDPDMVIYYSFDNFSNTVPDLSGKGYDATVVGDVKMDAGGKRAGAAKFTKTDTGSFLDLNSTKIPDSDTPVGAITVCAWLRPATIGADPFEIYSAREGTVNCHAELRVDTKVRWLIRSTANKTAFEIQAGVWNPDQWIHFAGTYSSADKIGVLYLNGEKIAEAVATGDNILNWSAGARIGMTVDNARPYIGLMDDFCLFKKALNQDDIKIIMVSGPPTASPVLAKGTLTTTWGNIKN